jgi:hypothetical protein
MNRKEFLSNKQGQLLLSHQDHISRIYDVLFSLTERVDAIEKHLCAKCNGEAPHERET